MLILKKNKLKALPILLSFTLLTISCGKDDPGDDSPGEEINGDIEFVKTYGGSESDEAISVVESADGNLCYSR